MAKVDEVKTKLRELIELSNETTGNNDKELTSAMGTLVEGYGKGATQEKTVDITENGTTEVTPDEGFALSKVTVNTNVERGGGDSLEGVFDDTATEINLPTITSLRGRAFYYSTAPVSVLNAPNLKSIGDYAFYYCVNFTLKSLPDGITSLGNGAFYECTSLALTSLPEGITEIPSNVFSRCLALSKITLPAAITTIGDQAFYSCSALKIVTFKGTPTSISTTAFKFCGGIKTINVPWAEGKVANAPWGATGATINYNYTEG